ncbi:MAG: hypothetical protein ACE5IT_08300 [bacterium]
MSEHRSNENWKVHDHIIAGLKKWLENQGKYVVANPGQEKNPNGSVKRGGTFVYPDLVVRPSEVEEIAELFEIETEDSVDPEEIAQWEMYNAGVSKFYLIVPKGSIGKAGDLIMEKGLSIAGVGYYDNSLNVHLPGGV